MAYLRRVRGRGLVEVELSDSGFEEDFVHLFSPLEEGDEDADQSGSTSSLRLLPSSASRRSSSPRRSSNRSVLVLSTGPCTATTQLAAIVDRGLDPDVIVEDNVNGFPATRIHRWRAVAADRCRGTRPRAEGSCLSTDVQRGPDG